MMATTADSRTESPPSGDSASTEDTEGTQTAHSVPKLLELLDNEHTQRILEALCQGPQRGRDLIDACEASRATIYRRLNQLEAAGVVTTELYVDPDGHHCETYRLELDRLRVVVESGTVSVTVQPRQEATVPAVKSE
jgi:DNA-binding HxlR family transcriptional regulator